MSEVSLASLGGFLPTAALLIIAIMIYYVRSSPSDRPWILVQAALLSLAMAQLGTGIRGFLEHERVHALSLGGCDPSFQWGTLTGYLTEGVMILPVFVGISLASIIVGDRQRRLNHIATPLLGALACLILARALSAAELLAVGKAARVAAPGFAANDEALLTLVSALSRRMTTGLVYPLLGGAAALVAVLVSAFRVWRYNAENSKRGVTRTL